MAVRLGFIGTGGIAGIHFSNFGQIPAAEVVAVFDAVPAAADRAAARFSHCTVYSTANDLINDASIDAVYICVPPFAHEDYEIRVAERGLPMLVEKPVGLDLTDARRAVDIIQRSGILNAAGYHWRYSPLVERAREMLADQRIALAEAVWLGGLPGSRWWRTQAMSGGQVVEQTTHMIDLLRYFLGEVKSVYAGDFRGLNQDVEGYDISDASSATVRFANGGVATILSSDLVPGYDTYTKLFCKSRTFEIRANSLRVVESGHVEEFTWRPVPYSHLPEDQAFIRAVENRDQSLIRSTFADAVKTLEVSLAINRSIDEGDVIHLPIE